MTKKAFVEVLLSQGQLALAESLVTVAEDVRRAAAERVKAGKVPLLEETKAQERLARKNWERTTQLVAAGIVSQRDADAEREELQAFESRVAARAWLLQSILPPIVFIFVGSCFLFVVGALFLPLVSMIQGLS